MNFLHRVSTLEVESMITRRKAEKINPVVPAIIGRTTIVVSAITFLLFVGWILSDEAGGLDYRNGKISAGYFNWHPLMMSATFLLFMTPAVLAFEVFPFSRASNKKFHGWMNTFSFITITIGLAVIIDCHINLTNQGLLKTIHSICGYMTFGILSITYFVAAISYGLGVGSGAFKAELKPYHKRLGTFTSFCGYATILLGLLEKVSDDQMKLGQTMAGCIFLVMLGVIFTLTKFVDKSDVDRNQEDEIGFTEKDQVN